MQVLCDVVVDLDQNLVMKEHCPKLAIMLMQSASTSTQGCAFSDILAGGEDQRSFEQIVVSSADQGADLSPSVFSINVRDSVGNSIRTVVHHIPYRNIVGHVHHLVGLSEDSAGPASAAAALERKCSMEIGQGRRKTLGRKLRRQSGVCVCVCSQATD